MTELPVSAIDIELLKHFCKEAEKLLKKSPSIMTQDTLGNIGKMLEKEERYGVTKKLLEAIFQIIYSRIIYGEISIEKSLTELLNLAGQDNHNSSI